MDEARSHLGMDVCCLQETWFSTLEYILSRKFVLYSAYFDGHLMGVSRLAENSSNAASVLIFADPMDRPSVLDFTIKNKILRLIMRLCA